MNIIRKKIEERNKLNQKALTLFLTGGFPNKNNFVDFALDLIDTGADLFELGIPFSDPIADGTTIQKTSKIALDNGTTIFDVFEYSRKISAKSNIPIILMGYSNPIYKIGLQNFVDRAIEAGVKGLIVPDVPFDEYNDFFNVDLKELNIILLTTPASNKDRIREIDNNSNGFVYCVSINGTTGKENIFNNQTIKSIEKNYNLIKKNKMQVGFGISSRSDIKKIKHTCDGIIVASSVLKKMLSEKTKINEVLNFAGSLAEECHSA